MRKDLPIQVIFDTVDEISANPQSVCKKKVFKTAGCRAMAWEINSTLCLLREEAASVVLNMLQSLDSLLSSDCRPEKSSSPATIICSHFGMKHSRGKC